MKALRRWLCTVTAAALVVTSVPVGGFGITAKAAGATTPDVTVKLRPD